MWTFEFDHFIREWKLGVPIYNVSRNLAYGHDTTPQEKINTLRLDKYSKSIE